MDNKEKIIKEFVKAVNELTTTFTKSLQQDEYSYEIGEEYKLTDGNYGVIAEVVPRDKDVDRIKMNVWSPLGKLMQTGYIFTNQIKYKVVRSDSYKLLKRATDRYTKGMYIDNNHMLGQRVPCARISSSPTHSRTDRMEIVVDVTNGGTKRCLYRDGKWAIIVEEPNFKLMINDLEVTLFRDRIDVLNTTYTKEQLLVLTNMPHLNKVQFITCNGTIVVLDSSKLQELKEMMGKL